MKNSKKQNMTKYWKKHFFYLLLNSNKIELICNVFMWGGE